MADKLWDLNDNVDLSSMCPFFFKFLPNKWVVEVDFLVNIEIQKLTFYKHPRNTLFQLIKYFNRNVSFKLKYFKIYTNVYRRFYTEKYFNLLMYP